MENQKKELAAVKADNAREGVQNRDQVLQLQFEKQRKELAAMKAVFLSEGSQYAPASEKFWVF